MIFRVFAVLRARMARIYLEERGFGSGREMHSAMIQMLEPGDVFLDAGCGQAPLRRSMPNGVVYVGLDRYFGSQHNEYSGWNMHPDVLGDVTQMPISTASCKVVALMHVLEHVLEPRKVLSEVVRVLKPGGHLFVDVPFLHEIHHAPNDHFRYTPYALGAIAAECGLDTVEIRPSGGYFRCVGSLLQEAPKVVSGRSCGAIVTRWCVTYPLMILGWLIKKVQYPLDLQDHRQEFTIGYHCIFRKPFQ